MRWEGRGVGGVNKGRLERRHTNRQDERDRKRIVTNCRRTVSGKDITRTRRNGERKVGRKGRIATYDNKARTKETGDAKHWRRDPKRRKKRGQRAACKTKRKVWWLGRLGREGRSGSRKDAPN